ncbi:signal recognition particle-docking protein FtsY [Chloroflexota bacterium]
MLGFLGKIEQGLKRTREAWWEKGISLIEHPTFDEGFWAGLEELLISADVGVNTSTKLAEQLKQRVEKEHIKETVGILNILKEEMASMLTMEGGKPFPTPDGGIGVILVVGVNGVGKTTSIAKLAYSLKGQGENVILAAGDTFRAAAIDQLQVWGGRVDIPVIAHQPNADPGAVVFDALETATRRKANFVIVDTAGRLHTKHNLMEELKKIKRVATRDQTQVQVLLVLDATTGQNGLSQAKHFAEVVAVDGVFLAKIDSTSKGGIVLAICEELKIPILFLGTGQELEDVIPFSPQIFVEALFSHKI